MKAIILAGGMGTRLHPLSLKRPKPMLPFFDAPLLEHIILCLRNSGFSDVCVSLCHMPDCVRDYFGSGSGLGVSLKYSLEREGRGTAGAVKLCEDFIGGDDFLVISGDAVTSFNLALLAEKHREAGAELSMALYECEDVSEYGSVYCAPGGRVLQINEKSADECACSQLANTGIYFMSASVLKRIPEARAYDFASELFPRLLQEGRALYGFCLPGCWFDVGNAEAYRRAALYALSHEEVPISARGGVRGCGSEAAYISPEAKVSPGAVIAPGCLICGDSEVASGAFIKNSIVCGAKIGEGAVINGAVIFPGSSIGALCAVEEGCVVADGACIGRESTLERGSVLYPGKVFPPCSHARGRFFTGLEAASIRFDSCGTARFALSEVSPVEALSMGCAAGKTGSVCAAYSGDSRVQALAEAFLSGAAARGARAMLLDAKSPAEAAFAANSYGAASCLFLSQTGSDAEARVYSGAAPGAERPFLRALEKAAASPASPRILCAPGGEKTAVNGVSELYLAAMKKLYSGGSCRISVCGETRPAALLRRALEECGIDARQGAPCAEFRVSASGHELSAADEKSVPIERDALISLAAFSLLRLGRRELAVSYDFPEFAEELLKDAGAAVLRLRRGGRAAERLFSDFPWCFDACLSAAAIIFRMAAESKTLTELCSETPQTARITRNYKAKGKRQDIYRALEALSDSSERIFGLKLRCTLGWAHIVPISAKEYRVSSEAIREEAAFLLNARCGEIIENT